MSELLLSLKDIHLTFGGTPLLVGAELNVAAGDRLCLVGRNGSGKSTLLRIAAGLADPDRGSRYLSPHARIAYLVQETDLSGFTDTLSFAESELGHDQDPHAARRLLETLGLTGAEHPEALSGGQARRAALARALAPRPDILLLDEPTNHLDLPAIEWLERELAVSRAAIVLISHDRRFLERLSRSTAWLDRGQIRRTERGFAQFEDWRDKVLEEEEIERHKLDRKIVREQHWMHGGVTGRRKRNVRRVAELAALRERRREALGPIGKVAFEAATAGQSGRLVIEAERLAKDYGAGPVVTEASVRVMRGDRLALVGPNGAGKTTLLKMLTGTLQPDRGTVKLGTGLEIVMIEQGRDELRPDVTVADALTGGRSDWVTINGESKHVSSYLTDFLFLPEQARSPLKVLSGGERARLMLARAFAKPSNMIVLDEPTNDLDLETLDLLQEHLAAYPGTVLLVSHDRDFLDRIATAVLVSEGDGRWVEYAGGYSDMLTQRGGSPLALGKAARPAKSADANLPSTPALVAAPARRKLSFKDKHALETLPATIAALETRIAGLSAELADPRRLAARPDGLTALASALAAAEAEHTRAEERWLELEMLREELEGGQG